MEMTHKHLEHVRALDRHRHYGRAAEALGISQPALSRSILGLEKLVGLALFERSRAGVTPSAAGQLLIRHAYRVAALTGGMENELRELKGQVQRTLNVACGYYPAELSVPGALSQLMNEQPGLNANLEVADWNRCIAQVRAQSCEIAIAEISAVAEASDLHTEPVNESEVFAFVRPGHPLAQSERPRLDELLDLPWACSRIPARAATQLAPGPRRAGEFDLESGDFIPRIVVSSLASTLRLVSENDLLGLAPLSIAEPLLASGALQLVRFRRPWLRLNYGFIRARHTEPSPAAREFMALIREHESRLARHERELARRHGIADW